MQSQSLVLSQKTLSQAACGAVMTRQFEEITTATRDKSHWRMASFSSSLQEGRVLCLVWESTRQISQTLKHNLKNLINRPLSLDICNIICISLHI